MEQTYSDRLIKELSTYLKWKSICVSKNIRLQTEAVALYLPVSLAFLGHTGCDYVSGPTMMLACSVISHTLNYKSSPVNATKLDGNLNMFKYDCEHPASHGDVAETTVATSNRDSDHMLAIAHVPLGVSELESSTTASIVVQLGSSSTDSDSDSDGSCWEPLEPSGCQKAVVSGHSPVPSLAVT